MASQYDTVECEMCGTCVPDGGIDSHEFDPHDKVIVYRGYDDRGKRHHFCCVTCLREYLGNY